jgi:hypothetical protein
MKQRNQTQAEMEQAYLRDPNRLLPERNLETYQKHRREIFWQITIPLLIGVLIVLVVAVGVTFGSAMDVSRWADISLIWLILPALLIALVLIVTAPGLCPLLLIRKLPPFMLRLQDFFQRWEGVRRVSDKAKSRYCGLKAGLLAGAAQAHRLNLWKTLV